MDRIRDMKGLGAKSEAILSEVGIHQPDQLRALGAIPAFLRLQSHQGKRPHLAFLYALVGAIEDRDWLEIARKEKTRLLLELDAVESMATLWQPDQD